MNACIQIRIMVMILMTSITKPLLMLLTMNGCKYAVAAYNGTRPFHIVIVHATPIVNPAFR